MSTPSGTTGTSSRHTARSRRRTVLRTTALPTALVTMKPNRLAPGVPRSSTCSTAADVLRRRPRRTVLRKSAGRTTRFTLASTCRLTRKGELSGQLGAALGTTSAQDGAAGAGAHAKTEAVNLGTTTVVRLESSLAHSGISKAQLWSRKEVGGPKAGSQLVKSTGLSGSGQTLCLNYEVIHMVVTEVGIDGLWTTKVKPSRIEGVDG